MPPAARLRLARGAGVVLSLLLLVALLMPRALAAAPVANVPGSQVRVGLLKSRASFAATSSTSAWEADGAETFLRAAGLEVVVLHDGEIDAAHLAPLHLVVLPNVRCLSPSAAAAIREHCAAGGSLLATMMSSYRDEANKRVGTENTFQLAETLGADFQRWTSGWPRCEHLQLSAELGQEVSHLLGRSDPVERIQLGRNTAMLVSTRAGALRLATWLDADGQPTTDARADGAALLATHDGRVVYCGENLFTPELLQSPEVAALVLALIRRATRHLSSMPQVPGNVHAALDALTLPRLDLPAVPPSGEVLRVGLKDGILHLRLPAGAAYRITGPGIPAAAGDPRVEGPLDITLEQPLLGHAQVACRTPHETWHAATLRIDAADPGTPMFFHDLRPNGTSRLHAVRGALELTPCEQGLRAINIVDLDLYTCGVVPNEVPAVSPTEALRSMAVVARTFSSQRRGHHARDGFDVCSTVHCQMYGGYLSEVRSTTQAVADTRGELLTLPAAKVDATFHAVCGGAGEAVERVWPRGPASYLCGGADGAEPLPDLSDEQAFRSFIHHPPRSWCEASPRFRWSESYTVAALQALFEESLPRTLSASYHGLGTLQRVQVESRSSLGRVQRMRIEGSHGSYTVERDSIRWLWSRGVLGQGGLQSTLFYIDDSVPGQLTFRGGGWGHGVGMCQDGAAGMARHGLTHEHILRHYYPGTRLVRLRAMAPALPSI